MIQTILVVCIGNICRSPIAEVLFKKKFPDKKIFSAGISGLIGYPADPHSVAVMMEHGIDISEHRAQKMDGDMLKIADIIFVMDLEQKQFIEKKYTSARGKVFRLGEFGNFDIPDPYREDITAFRRTYDLIQEGVKAASERLLRIA